MPAAHPYRWWGLYEPTEQPVPLRDRDQPVVLSGSALDQLANTCALQWFLGREVKADAPATAAQGFGNVVHVLADEVASGRTPADLAVLMERLDSVWNALAFDAPWKSRAGEGARARGARTLPAWHVMDRGGRTPVATRARLRRHPGGGRRTRSASAAPWTASRRTPRAARTSSTSRPASSPDAATRWPATRSSPSTSSPCARARVDEAFGGARPEPGGAELVQLRQGAAKKEGGETCPRCRRRSRWTGEWVGELLATAAGRVLDERFTPTAGPALHPLRLPRVVQRTAGGPARRGVSGAVTRRSRRPLRRTT